MGLEDREYVHEHRAKVEKAAKQREGWSGSDTIPGMEKTSKGGSVGFMKGLFLGCIVGFLLAVLLMVVKPSLLNEPYLFFEFILKAFGVSAIQ